MLATSEENLTDLVTANAERFGDAVALRRLVDGSWLDVTTKEFAGGVAELAKGLIAAGLRRGDRIALLTASGYEHAQLTFACWTAGCVAVPISVTATSEEIRHALADSAARAVVVDGDARHQTVCGLADRLSELVWVWQLDPPRSADGILEGPHGTVEELGALGSTVDDEAPHHRRLEVTADDPAMLRYPPGEQLVALSHGELLVRIRATIAEFSRLFRAGQSALVLLPLTHPLAMLASLSCLYTRTALGFLPGSGGRAGPAGDIGTFRPTFVVTAPATLRHVYDAAHEAAHREGRGRVFDTAAAVATEYGAALADSGPSPTLRVKQALAGRLAYPKLRAMLGGRCVAVLCAEPIQETLSPSYRHFFRGIGMTLQHAATPLAVSG